MTKLTPKSQCPYSGWWGPAWASLCSSLTSSLYNFSHWATLASKALQLLLDGVWQTSQDLCHCHSVSSDILAQHWQARLPSSFRHLFTHTFHVRPVGQFTQTRTHQMTPYCIPFVLYCSLFFSKAWEASLLLSPLTRWRLWEPLVPAPLAYCYFLNHSLACFPGCTGLAPLLSHCWGMERGGKVQHSVQEDNRASRLSRQNCTPPREQATKRENLLCVGTVGTPTLWKYINCSHWKGELFLKERTFGMVTYVYSVYSGDPNSGTHSPAHGRYLKFIFVLLQPMENTKLNLSYSYWNYEVIPKATYFLKGIISNVDTLGW